MYKIIGIISGIIFEIFIFRNMFCKLLVKPKMVLYNQKKRDLFE